ncbi:DUF4878 domain-containing protein [Cohnella sp. REN36]|uniref:DUF4878 domain-containing protein n=1 Tax=Cohnella sp. REN36 TaxID=2887347 RepID=UPI001D1342AC|nr:DUF4878 domain-containing protein [Cohnella sp. REN36]MCC3375450.1 DUF4878 domain-containing protein [Cohnella sp. REN36]
MLKQELKESKFKIKDHKILEVTKEGDRATVAYMVKISRNGEVETNDDSFDLVKVHGKWYIEGNPFDL